MMRTTALASALVSLLACASTQPKPAATQHSATPALATNTSRSQQQDGVESMLVCEMEKPIGSNIPERICRKATPDEVQRMKTAEEVRQMQRSGPASANR
jgi:hypothetical protein